MNKDLEKNRLDLAYHRQLSYLNAVLTFATIGLLSFIGTFLWNKDYLVYGFLIVIITSLISYYLYIKVNNNLRGISNEIKKL